MQFASVAAPVEAPRRARHVQRLAALVAVPTALLGMALLRAPAAHATPAPAGSLTRTFSQGAKDWTVPTGVYSVAITAAGGAGAPGSNGDAAGGAGGRGALVTETIAVVPGDVLHLYAGSAGDSTIEPGYTWEEGDLGGLPGAGGYVGGRGGRGGADTVIVKNSSTLVVVAGAGGGGGGGGAVAGDNGGSGGSGGGDGTGGSGAFGGTGSGGTGQVTWGEAYAASQDVQAGQDATNVAPPASSAGGGGGGGGGLNGLTGAQQVGGGHAGGSGTTGGGGGGGGAGGASTALDPNAVFGTAPGTGDGYVTLSWTPGVASTTTLTAPASVGLGSPVTLTATIGSSLSGGPTPTGTVTFQYADPWGDPPVNLGQATLSGGKASATVNLPGGSTTQPVHALYSGDATYFSSMSDYSAITLIPPVRTLSITPNPLDFGSPAVGSTTTKDVTLTNTGNTAWSYSDVTSSDSTVTVSTAPCATLAPGASCTATVAFQPTDGSPVSATLSFEGNFPTTSITVTGTGIPQLDTLSVPSAPVDFGSQPVGSRTTQDLSLTDVGNITWIRAGDATGGWASTDPSVSIENLCSGMSPTLTCTATVVFQPTAPGPVSATVSLYSITSTQTFTVTGTGVATPSVSVTPTPLRFGNVVVGKSVTKTVTLTNTGTADWTFSSVSSDNPAFVVTTPPCATLAPGAHCTATVAFRPGAPGRISTTLSFTGNSGTTSITVAGTGVQAAPIVTGISPNHGSPRGGTHVTITGRNLTGVTAIRIGGVAMKSVSCTSTTTCTAITPAGSGTKDIRVVTPGGTSAAVPADRFTFRS